MSCANCHQAHHTWQCPEVRALLFAPFTDVCVSCGDALGYDAPLNTVCAACQETGEIIAGMVHDAFGIPLVLRASVRKTATERVDYAPF